MLTRRKMCFECGSEYECGYCGDECFGACEDPDTCHTCWGWKYLEDDYSDDGEAIDSCIDSECTCACHVGIYEDLAMRFEAGVMFHDIEGPPYERKGIFHFLSVSPFCLDPCASLLLF